jgi:hypothetical protein
MKERWEEILISNEHNLSTPSPLPPENKTVIGSVFFSKIEQMQAKPAGIPESKPQPKPRDENNT